MIEKLKNNKLLIYAIITLFIIITIITSKIILGKELFIDKLAYNIIVEQLRNPTMTIFMKNITKLGNTTTMIVTAIITSIIFLIKEKRKNIAMVIPSSLLLITIMNLIIKSIFKRPRPMGYRLIEITGFSFPSGHSVASMTFYGLLIYIIYHLVKNKILRNILITINIIIISLIGFSRVYLGVHYLSDVIAGYLISIIYLLILVKVLKKYKIFP